MEKNEMSNILEKKYKENLEKYKYDFNEQTFYEISSKLVESSKHFIPTFDYNFGRGRTPIQKIKNFIKRVIRKSTRFMLQPYAEKMYRFQELNGEITGSLTEYAKYSNNILSYIIKENQEIKNKFIETHNHLENFESTLWNIIKENQEIKNKFIETHNHLENFESTLWNIIKEKDKVQEEFFKYESYSQTGEDKIIDYLLNYGGNEKKGVSYLDIGCNDWRNLSNSYRLYRRGIRGVLIDANPIYIDEIKIFRPEDIVLNCGIGKEHSEELTFNILNQSDMSSFNIKTIEEAQKYSPWLEIVKKVKVPVYTLSEIYKKHFVTTPTIVSLDVEGDELEILKEADFEMYRPYIFVIETVEYRDKISVDNKRNDIIDFMIKNDYIEYAFTGVNSIFVDRRKL